LNLSSGRGFKIGPVEASATTAPAPAAPPGDRELATVTEILPGRRFAGRFACVRRDRLVARNGSTYLALELRDRTGTLKARVFRDADRIAGRFDRGDAVFAQGRAERFRGELVAELDDVRRLEPGGYDPADLLPSAYRSIEELEGFLEHLAREVHDPGLAAAVKRVVFAEPTWTEFRRAPCTRAGHHAYLGGLIEHTVAVASLVGEVCQLHPRLDSDLLMAAAIVHDVGKVREFAYAAEIELSEEGRALGHLAIGAEIIGAAAHGLDDHRRLALLGCVLFHHGPEAGAARAAGASRSGFPSPEALALYRLNALDASVKGALEHGI
jgi:3'-5' exoribonuclease